MYSHSMFACIGFKSVTIKSKCDPWFDDDIRVQRDILTSAKRLSRVCSSKENLNLAKIEAKNLSDLYISKREIYLESLCKEIDELNAEKKCRQAWKMIDLVSGRKGCSTGSMIPADSISERLSIWKNHFQKVLAPQVDNSINQTFSRIFDMDLDFNVSNCSVLSSQWKIIRLVVKILFLSNS